MMDDGFLGLNSSDVDDGYGFDVLIYFGHCFFYMAEYTCMLKAIKYDEMRISTSSTEHAVGMFNGVMGWTSSQRMNFTRDCVLCLWIVFDDTVSWVCTYMYSNLFRYIALYIHSVLCIIILSYIEQIHKTMCISIMYVDKCV